MSETALKKIDAHVGKNKIYIMEVDQVFCSKFKYTKSLLSHSPLKSDRKEEEGCHQDHEKDPDQDKELEQAQNHDHSMGNRQDQEQEQDVKNQELSPGVGNKTRTGDMDL